MNEIETVILCGGKGLRFRSVADNIPKPMAIIGKYPILVHIMKFYASYGFRKFILCLGHLGNKIIEYFDENKSLIDENNWDIKFVDTGQDTMTGSRIKRIENYIKGDNFSVTYGDGVSDHNLKDLYNYHLNKGKIGTVTLVKARSNFGIIKINEYYLVESFLEKPIIEDWINGGFFIFKKEVFDYLDYNDCILEKDTLPELMRNNELVGYIHHGFWACMDTYKDYIYLNEIYANNGGFTKRKALSTNNRY